MIAEDPDDGDDNFEDGPSKSQLKRDAHAIRELAAELAALGASERARVPLPEDIVEAIDLLNRSTKNGARKRQLGLIAKKMRKIDIEPVEAALESIRQAARANTQNQHLVENWRDRLLGDVDGESPKTALTEFVNRYPHADAQHIRQLQRAAAKEKQHDKPPRSARLLFKIARDVVNFQPDAS